MPYDVKQMEQLKRLHNECGAMIFAMGMTHLMDVGIRNMTAEVFEKAKRKIHEQAIADKAKGRNRIMTEEIEIGILRAAYNLAQFSPLTLLLYVKLHMHIDGDKHLENVEAEKTCADWLRRTLPEFANSSELIEGMATILVLSEKEYPSGALYSAYNTLTSPEYPHLDES